MKTFTIGPVESLIKRDRSLRKKPDLSVGCLKRLQRCCKGSFDGRHRLKPDASQPYSRTDRVYTLCILYFGTAGGESAPEVGMNPIILQRMEDGTMELTRGVCIMVWFSGYSL